MNKYMTIGIIVIAASLGGCAELTNLEANLASPTASAAVANLKAGAQVLVCSVASAAQTAQQVEAAVSAGTAIVKDTTDVYVASTIVCGSLGGVVTATAKLPASS